MKHLPRRSNAPLCLYSKPPPPPTHPLPAHRRRPWADLSYLKRVAGHRTVPVERGSNYLATDFDEQARSAWLEG